MNLNPNIFKAYDIRGIYPQDINENNFPHIINAIFSFFKSKIKKEKIKLVLGHDMRVSSPNLYNCTKKTLIDLGATILDIGMVSTPTFYFSVLNLNADCGIQISASHNPPQWNGIKFVVREGKKIVKIGKNTGMEEVKNNIKLPLIKASKNGQIINISNIVKKEIDFAFELFNINPKEILPLKIVVDPANAMGISYLEELFSRLPCQLIKMNFNYDGTFPAHEPNPLIFENLKDLQKKVVLEKADLGIAPDGDGDRVFFINEKGEVIWASLISSIIAAKLLKDFKNDKIGVDVRYLFNITNAVEKNGGKVIVGPVGHALISDLMIKNDILFTGESSGHFFFRQFGYAESASAVILLILDEISKKRMPISKIVSQLQSAYESGERNFILPDNISPKKVMDEIAKDYFQYKINWLDGLSVDLLDSRFNIRASNTEPLMRLNVESYDIKKLKKLFNEITDKILNLVLK